MNIDLKLPEDLKLSKKLKKIRSNFINRRLLFGHSGVKIFNLGFNYEKNEIIKNFKIGFNVFS